eukprot:CAMPEP_0178927278 /NCGR_PEP_ID=MMETSP0786-20121207/19085_1 /TAXON_ID=186022 /ORGANISM="Thalassionema frauenfeldii, Strain CCMP 1798" /LENGTH=454 /DNA_ID=CAMNT_0020602665 /DNA_START=185 /DNA_END=1549 /DNA_ORIENTATION=-
MDFNTTVQDVTSFFSTFGVVNFVKIITDARTKRSRGFGFLYMLDAVGDSAVASFAAENNHRITLQGKARVFLNRHDSNREQPRKDGKRDHDGNLEKDQNSSYHLPTSYGNTYNRPGVSHTSLQPSSHQGSYGPTITPQNGTAPPSQRSYEPTIQDPYRSTPSHEAYASNPGGSSAQYQSSFQQQYQFSQDPAQSSPYSQPQSFSAPTDYIAQPTSYPPSQVPPQFNQSTSYQGPVSTYGGQPVQQNGIAQYSHQGGPPQQVATYPPYSSVTNNQNNRETAYSNFSDNSIIHDSQQGQQRDASSSLAQSSLPLPNHQAPPSTGATNSLSTKVLIQNLPRDVDPKDIVQILSEKNLTVSRCTIEYPTGNLAEAFAHVDLISAGDAATCLLFSQRQQLSLSGRVLTASLDQSPPAEGTNVYAARGNIMASLGPIRGRGGRGRGRGRYDRKQRFDRPY